MSGVVLDTGRMKVGPDGLAGLDWPVRRCQLIAMRDAFLEGIVALARAWPRANEAEAISILCPHIWTESMALFNAGAVARHYLERGKQPVLGPHHRLLRALVDGKAPAPPPALKTLLAGPRRPSTLRAPLRLARGLLLRDGLTRVRLRSPDVSREAIAIDVVPLIRFEARASKEMVTYRGVHNWFGPLDSNHIEEARRRIRSAGLREAIRDIATAAFEAGKQPMGLVEGRYLERCVTDMLAAITCHIQRLDSAPARLPKRLWTGAGTPFWPRMLRHATRRFGGRVTGHDHVPGAGYTTSIQKTVVDFEACDRFITFSEGQVAGYTHRTLRRDLLIQDDPPAISAAHYNGEVRLRSEKRDAAKRVMVVAGEYTAEKMRGIPLLPDPIAVDWHARLFTKLREWRYQVDFKPHPESDGTPPARFTDMLGHAPLTKRFELVLEGADVILFDWPRTSTFSYAMLAGKAMVLVDFELGFFTDEARALLDRRCAVVPGNFDSDNRCQVDWTALRDAIEQSIELRDDAFARTYFENRMHG